MRALEVILKMHKHDLEGIIQDLKETESQKSKTEELVNQIENRIITEANKYEGTEYNDILITYLEFEENRLKNYRAQIHDFNDLIANLQDKILDVFTEVKKIELLMQKRKIAIKKQEDKLEDNLLDEISSIATNIN